MPLLSSYYKGMNEARIANDNHEKMVHNQRVADYEFERKRNTLDPRADLEHDLDYSFKDEERRYKFDQLKMSDSLKNDKEKLDNDAKRMANDITQESIRRDAEHYKANESLRAIQTQNSILDQSLSMMKKEDEQDKLLKDRQARIDKEAYKQAKIKNGRAKVQQFLDDKITEAELAVAVKNITDGNVSEADISSVNDIFMSHGGLVQGEIIEDVGVSDGGILFQIRNKRTNTVRTFTIDKDYTSYLNNFGEDTPADSSSAQNDIQGHVSAFITSLDGSIKSGEDRMKVMSRDNSTNKADIEAVNKDVEAMRARRRALNRFAISNRGSASDDFSDSRVINSCVEVDPKKAYEQCALGQPVRVKGLRGLYLYQGERDDMYMGKYPSFRRVRNGDVINSRLLLSDLYGRTVNWDEVRREQQKRMKAKKGRR